MTPLLLLGLLGFAEASDFNAGVQSVYNDAFLTSRSLALGGSLTFAPGARLALNAAFSPDLGDGNLTTLSRQLTEDFSVNPDLSRMVWDTDLALVVEPFRGRVGKLGTAMALYAGMGAVRTEDETTAGRGDGEPRFADTQSQVHPSGVWGVLGDVYLNERVGLRFRWHHMSYIETVDSTITSMKTNGRVGFEAVFVLDDPSRAPLRRSP